MKQEVRAPAQTRKELVNVSDVVGLALRADGLRVLGKVMLKTGEPERNLIELVLASTG